MLPVDHHTSFHKTCGVATFALAALHAAMHLANIALNLAEDNFGAFVAENGMEVGLLGDTSLWSKPPVDTKTKVAVQYIEPHTKTELLF